ncbi:iron-sulfur cluster assembly accessory protein [uncultured Buchnera sp.]|jgi:Fe-S cluster assembly protein SufA|uniref:HesB/IscA family protein n=1 Tax=uncultured Buchnera sp. TaxID=574037 RepID=UPI0025CE6856|nr:iron-sulfur cluster assembly accessory protein [uncultured Buchnera sp.]
MKTKKINAYLPHEHQWKGIEITKKALKQILFLISNNSENKGIRIGTKKSGCAGFRYTMELVKDKEVIENKNDIIFYYKNVLVYISLKEAPLLNGIKIDFIKDSINEVFKYYNPKIEKFCGCGESFSID